MTTKREAAMSHADVDRAAALQLLSGLAEHRDPAEISAVLQQAQVQATLAVAAELRVLSESLLSRNRPLLPSPGMGSST